MTNDSREAPVFARGLILHCFFLVSGYQSEGAQRKDNGKLYCSSAASCPPMFPLFQAKGKLLISNGGSRFLPGRAKPGMINRGEYFTARVRRAATFAGTLQLGEI